VHCINLGDWWERLVCQYSITGRHNGVLTTIATGRIGYDTQGFKAKSNAHIMSTQGSSLHTYHTENGYKIKNVTIYNIYY
jgi:hypothetical protein